MRARYVRRVTADDVGARVSVRRWVEDPERGTVPSDVVGRLVAWEEGDVLRIERRDGTRVAVPNAEVLASRVIPEPPERGPVSRSGGG